MRQQQLDNQLKRIEQRKRKNTQQVFNNRPSIAHIAKSSGIVNRLNSIRNSKNIKRMFSNGFKNAADSLVEKETDLEFEEGCVPIQSIQTNAKTTDFTGVVRDLQRISDINKNDPLSTTIKRHKSSLADTIETDLTVSSVFGRLYHITNNGDMVDVSDNDETRYDLIALLESEYCRDLSFSCHNCHRDEDTIWYDYVDINAINNNNYYEPIAALSEVLNDVEELVVPDSATVKQNNIFDANKLESPDKYRIYDLPREQMDDGAKCTITNNINLLKNVKWYS